MLMNTYGDSITDHYRSMNICNDVLTYSDKYLDKNGHILCKFYTGLSLLLCLLHIIHDCAVYQFSSSIMLHILLQSVKVSSIVMLLSLVYYYLILLIMLIICCHDDVIIFELTVMYFLLF